MIQADLHHQGHRMRNIHGTPAIAFPELFVQKDYKLETLQQKSEISES
jgi:hypothetical protein